MRDNDVTPRGDCSDVTFGKRKKSHSDVPSLESYFSPTNASEIARCGLAHCTFYNEGYVRHSSTSLVTFIPRVLGGFSKHFFKINLIDSLTFRQPINVDNPWILNKKIIIELNFDLRIRFLLPRGLGLGGSSNAWIVA